MSYSRKTTRPRLRLVAEGLWLALCWTKAGQGLRIALGRGKGLGWTGGVKVSRTPNTAPVAYSTMGQELYMVKHKQDKGYPMACTIDGCSNIGRNRGYGKRGELCNKHHRLKYPRNKAYYMRRNNTARFKPHGISLQEYNCLVEKQNNVCAICGLTMEQSNIDHCHTTDCIRGILCNKCNWGLGMFNDDLDLLASASSYLINSRLKVTG